MRQRVLSPLPVIIGGLAALVLSGCAAPGDAAEPEAAEPEAAAIDVSEAATDADETTDDADALGEALFSYGDETYSAQLQSCAFSGGEDALFHGTAHDESGDAVGYLDGDFGGLDSMPYGEVRLDFGATGQFESADSFIALGDAASSIVVTDFSDDGLIIMGAPWDQDGTSLPVATLRVTC